MSQAVFALFRWKGWLDPLPLDRPEARLLFAWLIDAPAVHPACRVWARIIGRDPTRVVSLGGAPSWTARAEGWKRLHEGIGVTVDPWRLFPQWLREHLPLPPGSASPKMKYLELLNALQSRPPLWVRAQGAEPRKVWDELAALGLKPWVHRRVEARGEARAGGERPPSRPVQAGPARDPGPRLAGRRPGVRPRPGRTVVGRLRGGGRQGAAPLSPDAGQRTCRRDRRERIET